MLSENSLNTFPNSRLVSLILNLGGITTNSKFSLPNDGSSPYSKHFKIMLNRPHDDVCNIKARKLTQAWCIMNFEKLRLHKELDLASSSLAKY